MSNELDRYYGMLAEFETAEALVEAAKAVRSGGYRKLDAFTPFPIKQLEHVLKLHEFRVPIFCLWGGIAGFCIALLMQLYINYDYPLNVGGRPQYALTAFAVVTFELTILFAALAAAIGMLALNGLPRLHHPLFEAQSFRRASNDRFLLCVMASDPQFDLQATRAMLRGLSPKNVELVPT